MFNKTKSEATLGKKMWAVMRKGGLYPVCLSDEREDAIKSLDSTYTLLIEMEITKVSKAHVHFCDCDSCNCGKS